MAEGSQGLHEFQVCSSMAGKREIFFFAISEGNVTNGRKRFHSIYLMTSHEEKPFIIPFTLIGPNGQKFVQLKLPR